MKKEYDLINVLLIAPDPLEFVSGGNIYNQNLFQFLDDEIIHIDWITSPEFKDIEIARYNYCIIDSIFIKDYSLIELISKENKVILILHYLKILPVILEMKNYIHSIIITGKYAQSVLCEHNYPVDKMLLIEPVVSIQPTIRSYERIGPMRYIIVANLIVEKGILNFLESLSTQLSNYPGNFIIDIFGDDRLDTDYSDKVKRHIIDTQLSNFVSYKGIIPHRQLLNQLGCYDAFISISKNETYGMAVKEAIVAGLPIVALKSGNIVNLVSDEETGYLFNDLTELIHFIMENRNSKLSVISNQDLNVVPLTWQGQQRLLISHLMKNILSD